MEKVAGFDFEFTKKLAQNYKGKCGQLIFLQFTLQNVRNIFHGRICLINMVLLIPKLLWFIKFYVV